MTPSDLLGVSRKCRAGDHDGCTVETCQCAHHPGGRVKVAKTKPDPLPPVNSNARSEIVVTPGAIAFIHGLSDSEIRARLVQRGLPENVIEDLVRDRETVGARWRLIQELYQ